MEPIKNEMDISLKRNKYAPIHEEAKHHYQLDFLYSDDLSEIEKGIVETSHGIENSMLAIALAIVKIDHEALYIQAGYKNTTEYINGAENRLNMAKQTISSYRRIGETYLKYKNRLQQVGFEEAGNLNKLRYLEQAVETHGDKKEVFTNLNRLSFRDFLKYAAGEPEEEQEESTEEVYVPTIEVTKTSVTVDGERILNFPRNMNPQVKEDIRGLIYKSYKIKAGGNVPYIVETYDEGEQRAIDNFLKKYRSKK